MRKDPLFLAAKQVCLLLQKSKHDAYIVGGAVRDLLLNPNKIPKDFDIATSAKPEEVRNLFKNSIFVGQAFGVCLVNLQGQHFEVTSFRKEGRYLDKRRPENIQIGTFKDDCNRRDFTINSIYYDPVQKHIIDPHLGINDIKQKLIRCVGSAENRLQEDALRILRMIRFAANLSFTLDNESLNAARNHSTGLQDLSKERIILEFQKVKRGKFYIFCEHLENILDLKELIFPNGSYQFTKYNIHSKNQLARSKIKLDTHLPFFNLLKYFLYKNKVKKESFSIILKTIDQWPITAEDKKICTLFLKCIFFKELFTKDMDIELFDFLFYELIAQIDFISKQSSRIILITLSVFINDNLLKETLYKMIDKISKNEIPSIKSNDIVMLIENNQLDKKYISLIMKYLQYIYLKKGLAPKLENLLQFKGDLFKEYFAIGNLNV